MGDAARAKGSSGFARHLAGIALFAWVIRVAYVLVTKRTVNGCGRQLCGDEIYYALEATFAAAGRAFRDFSQPELPAAAHPPLTTLILALPAWFADGNVLVLRLAMCVFGAGSVVLIGLLARRVAGDRAGLIAAAIAALHPGLWVNDGMVMSETFVVSLAAGVLLLVYRFIDEPRWSTALAAGGLCGLGALTRGEQALLLPITVAPSMLLAPGWDVRRRVMAVALAGVGATLVVAPWVAFNLSRFERPLLIASNLGETLVGANSERSYYGFWPGIWDGTAIRYDGEAVDASVRNAENVEKALAFVRENLERVPAIVAIRIGRVWSVYRPRDMVQFNRGEGREAWVSWLGVYALAILAPLALWGGAELRRRKRPVWPLASTAVVVTLTAALFYGLVRLRVPADLAMVVLAAVALAGLSGPPSVSGRPRVSSGPPTPSPS